MIGRGISTSWEPDGITVKKLPRVGLTSVIETGSRISRRFIDAELGADSSLRVRAKPAKNSWWGTNKKLAGGVNLWHDSVKLLEAAKPQEKLRQQEKTIIRAD